MYKSLCKTLKISDLGWMVLTSLSLWRLRCDKWNSSMKMVKKY